MLLLQNMQNDFRLRPERKQKGYFVKKKNTNTQQLANSRRKWNAIHFSLSSRTWKGPHRPSHPNGMRVSLTIRLSRCVPLLFCFFLARGLPGFYRVFFRGLLAHNRASFLITRRRVFIGPLEVLGTSATATASGNHQVRSMGSAPCLRTRPNPSQSYPIPIQSDLS